jgi:hypothetical protein
MVWEMNTYRIGHRERLSGSGVVEMKMVGEVVVWIVEPPQDWQMRTVEMGYQ